MDILYLSNSDPKTNFGRNLIKIQEAMLDIVTDDIATIYEEIQGLKEQL